MKNYVIINGVNSNTITGLAINELPPISKPPLRTLIEEIDGRDGDLITELGYGAYDKVMTIGLYHTFDIDQIIAFFNGSGTIVFSNEPDKYYNYKIIDQIDYEKLINFKTATITLHCQPFKYPLEEIPIITQYETITETGENLTIENTKEAPMQLTYKGNTQQDSTTGKNLLPNNATSQTINGITFTKNSDGTITANGTATATATLYMGNANSLTEGGTYTISSGLNGTSNVRFGISVNGTYYNTDGDRTQTFENITSSGNSYYQIDNGKSVSNLILYPMIVKSSTAGDYEPYTNGASPNPDYPQEIHVVTGDNEVTICGKNMFDKDNANVLNAYISNDSNTVVSNNANRLLYISCQPNTTYTFRKIASATFAVAYTKELPQGGVTIYNFSNSTTYLPNNYKAITITTGESAKYLVCRFMQTAQDTMTQEQILATVQIEKGSTATEYEAYTGQSQLISLGVENLLPSEITFVNKYLNYDGTASSAPDWTLIDTYIEVQPSKTYKASCTNMGARFIWCEYDSSKQVIGNRIENTTGIMTTSSTTKYIKFCTNSNTADNWQLELGSKQNRVSTTPIELNKIGTYQDYFYKTDKWYLHKEIGKAIFKGGEDEGWVRYGAYGQCYMYYIDNETDGITPDTKKVGYGYGLSNYFTWTSINDNTAIAPYIRFQYNNGKRLYIGYETDLTLANFKSWLSTHNTIVYYVLATPTDTEITDTTLLGQLEAIKKSYEGITNISQDNNDEPFELEVTAETLNSGIAYINNIGNIYSKPKIDIEGNGVVNVSLNNEQLFSVNVEEEIIIDSTNLEAYKPDGTLQNRQVTGNIGNLKLPSGTSTISFSGDLGKATITDYTRWL